MQRFIEFVNKVFISVLGKSWSIVQNLPKMFCLTLWKHGNGDVWKIDRSKLLISRIADFVQDPDNDETNSWKCTIKRIWTTLISSNHWSTFTWTEIRKVKETDWKKKSSMIFNQSYINTHTYFPFPVEETYLYFLHYKYYFSLFYLYSNYLTT